MSLTNSIFAFQAGATQTKDNTPFASTSQDASVSFAVAPDTSVMNRVLLASYTIAPAGTQTVDLYSFTDKTGDAVTATKARGLAIEASGDTGILKIEPGGTDPATWFLSGTTPAISLNCGTDGCGIALYDGSSYTLSSTTRNLKLSNTGAASITVNLYALVGT